MMHFIAVKIRNDGDWEKKMGKLHQYISQNPEYKRVSKNYANDVSKSTEEV